MLILNLYNYLKYVIYLSIFTCVRKITKSEHYLRHVCLSVHFSVRRSVCINTLNTELNPIWHLLILLDLTFMGKCIVSIFQYISNKMQRYTVYLYLETALHFGWYFHPSSGTHTTVPTASGICHTVTAICRYRGKVGTGLSVLWVAYASHSTLKPVPTLPR
jgi:hypothetical protein